MKTRLSFADSSSPRPRRGMALIAVVIMMVLVAAAVAAMGVLFTSEVKRTHAAVAGAQLRQLLLAADPAAREELNRNNTPHDLTLQTPITAATLKLHLTPAGEKATVRALARIGNTAATSITTYTHSEKGWTLESASLSSAQ